MRGRTMSSAAAASVSAAADAILIAIIAAQSACIVALRFAWVSPSTLAAAASARGGRVAARGVAGIAVSAAACATSGDAPLARFGLIWATLSLGVAIGMVVSLSGRAAVAEAAAKRAADDAACAVSEREEERAADLARVPALEAELDRAKRRLTACRDSIDSMLAAKETAEAAAREAREEAARASSAADKKVDAMVAQADGCVARRLMARLPMSLSITHRAKRIYLLLTRACAPSPPRGRPGKPTSSCASWRNARGYERSSPASVRATCSRSTARLPQRGSASLIRLFLLAVSRRSIGCCGGGGGSGGVCACG